MDTPTAEAMIADLEERFFNAAARTAQHPMTSDAAELLITLWHTEPEEAEKMFPAMAAEFPAATLVSRRAKCFRRGIDPRVCAMLAFQVERPGDAMLYMAYAMWQAKRRRLPVLDLQNFVEIFGNGFWSRSDRSGLYEAQRLTSGHIDNALDHPAIYEWLNAEEPART